MAPRKPRTKQRLLIAWSGDVARVKAFLDAHHTDYQLTTHGYGANWRLTIATSRNGFSTGHVTARPGDTLRYIGSLLMVEKRPPRRPAPPPQPHPTLEDALNELEAET